MKIHKLPALLIGLTLTLAIDVPWGVSHSGIQLSDFGSATVDGIISLGEYDSCISGSAAGYGFTFCETNDAANDYYGFVVNDTTASGSDDSINILFDNNHDGSISPCPPAVEDALVMRGNGVFADTNYCIGGGSLGETSHGSGAVTFTSSVGYAYEMSHPLNSGEATDYVLILGSTVGWCLFYTDDGVPDIDFDFPSGCFLPVTQSDSADYADIVKAFPPQSTVTVTASFTTTSVPDPTTVTSTIEQTVTVVEESVVTVFVGQTVKAVGGEFVPVDKTATFLPWVGLLFILAVITIVFVGARKNGTGENKRNLNRA